MYLSVSCVGFVYENASIFVVFSRCVEYVFFLMGGCEKIDAFIH